MGDWKMKMLKIFIFNGLKNLTLVVTFFSNTPKKQSKKLKQNQLDDCKVKILENQSEFDILTKD